MTCGLEYGVSEINSLLHSILTYLLLMTIYDQLPYFPAVGNQDWKRTRSQTVTIRGSCALTTSKITLLGIAIGSCNVAPTIIINDPLSNEYQAWNCAMGTRNSKGLSGFRFPILRNHTVQRRELYARPGFTEPK